MLLRRRPPVVLAVPVAPVVPVAPLLLRAAVVPVPLGVPLGVLRRVR